MCRVLPVSVVRAPVGVNVRRRPMQRFALALTVLSLVVSPIARAAEVVTTCANGLSLSATVDPTVKDFRFWENLTFFERLPHLEATLRVANKSVSALRFSTANVLLSAKGQTSTRAYVKSIASRTIDREGVQLAQGEATQLTVYWPVQIGIGTVAHDLTLACNAARPLTGRGDR